MSSACEIGNCPKRIVSSKGSIPRQPINALTYNCQSDDFSTGLIGAIHGVAGMFGLGDFWSVMDRSELDKIQDTFDKQADAWDECIQNCEYEVLEKQEDLKKAVESNKELIQRNRDEIVDERLKINSLMIFFSLSFIILIYIFILTEPKK